MSKAKQLLSQTIIAARKQPPSLPLKDWQHFIKVVYSLPYVTKREVTPSLSQVGAVDTAIALR